MAWCSVNACIYGVFASKKNIYCYPIATVNSYKTYANNMLIIIFIIVTRVRVRQVKNVKETKKNCR